MYFKINRLTEKSSKILYATWGGDRDRLSRRLSARKCKGTSRRSEPGTLADGDRDRDPAGKFKADYCRRPWSDPELIRPGTLDTDFNRFFSSGTPTRNKDRRPSADQSRPCSRNEKTLNRHLGRSERPSAPTPEHWTNRADSSRPYSGIFQAIRADYIPSSARTETGTEWSQGDPLEALKG